MAFSLALPHLHEQLQPSLSFMPALIAAVTVFDLTSVYLLALDFRDRGELRTLVTMLAYVWSLVVMYG